MRQFNRGARAVLFVATALPAHWAFAQSAPAPVPTSEADIVVTAQKRSQSILDVPLSISALNSDTLSRSGTNNLRDFVTSVPGVALFDFGNNQSTVVFRGLTTAPDGETNGGTVAFYFDEVALGTGRGVFSVKPIDIERVEVLRGPQGTLYGAGSIGGTYRTISRKPDANRVAFGGAGTLYGQDRGNEAGYDVSAYLNVPIVPGKLAARVAAYTDRDPNYVLNITRGVKVGGGESRGLRASIGGEPVDGLNVLFQYVYQKSDAFGGPQSHIDLPIFQQARQFEGVFQTQHLGAATLTYDFGPAALTSVTSYLDTDNDYNEDATVLIGAPSVIQIARRTKVTSQEVRLTSAPGGSLDWIVGGFYEGTRSDRNVPIVTPDRQTPILLFVRDTTNVKQYAAFGEITFRPSPVVSVTAGARHAKFSGATTFTDGIVLSAGAVKVDRGDSTFNPKLNIAFTPDKRTLIYAQVAKGFRAGGARQPLGPTCALRDQASPSFRSDEVISYEAGSKLSSGSGRFTVSGAVYYNDWKNIPVFIGDASCGQAYVANAGRAETYGVELEFTARPLDGLALGASIARSKSKLVDPGAIGGAGVRGEALPGTPDWVLSARADYEFPIATGRVVKLGADVNYVGRYQNGLSGDFSSSAAGFTPPFNTQFATDPGSGDYLKANARIGIRFDDRVELTAFVSNLTNTRRRVLFNYLSGSGAPSFTFVQPRRIGITLKGDF